MVLCQVIRASSTVGVSALTTFARLNAHTKYTSCIRKFGVSSAAFSGKILFFYNFFDMEKCDQKRAYSINLQAENIRKNMNGFKWMAILVLLEFQTMLRYVRRLFCTPISIDFVVLLMRAIRKPLVMLYLHNCLMSEPP